MILTPLGSPPPHTTVAPFQRTAWWRDILRGKGHSSFRTLIGRDIFSLFRPLLLEMLLLGSLFKPLLLGEICFFVHLFGLTF